MGRRSGPEDLVGETLEGRFRIVRLLGVGGMGAVYEARHVRLNARVAVKVLNQRLAQDERQRKRFLREAQAAARICSEHVITIMDFGEAPVAFFVMEYLDGRDLGKVLRHEGKLEWTRVRKLALQATRALAAAHQVGIVHRDVKPPNIFLLERDGVEFVKMLDFGIAKVAESSPDTRDLTRTDEVMGTVSYISPEQARASRIDPRTDVYSLGVVLFELVTGMQPFTGTSPYQIIDQHVRRPPPAPRSLEPTVPRAVEDLILRALAKDPSDRFQGMDEFAIAIERTSDEGAVVLELPRSEPLRSTGTGGAMGGGSARRMHAPALHAVREESSRTVIVRPEPTPTPVANEQVTEPLPDPNWVFEAGHPPDFTHTDDPNARARESTNAGTPPRAIVMRPSVLVAGGLVCVALGSAFAFVLDRADEIALPPWQVAVPSDAVVLAQIRRGARECLGGQAANVSFQVMQDGSVGFVRATPTNPCVADVTKAAAFASRPEVASFELDLAP